MQGADVLINGYDATETDAALAALRDQHPHRADGRPRVAGLPGDVTEPALAPELVDEAVRVFARLDHRSTSREIRERLAIATPSYRGRCDNR